MHSVQKKFSIVAVAICVLFSSFPWPALGVVSDLRQQENKLRTSNNTATPFYNKNVRDTREADKLAQTILLSVLSRSMLGVSDQYQRSIIQARFNLKVRNPSLTKNLSLQSVRLIAKDPAMRIPASSVNMNTILLPGQSIAYPVTIFGVPGRAYSITAVPYSGFRNLSPIKLNILIPGALLLAPKEIFDLNKIFTCNEDFPAFKQKTKNLILGGRIDQVKEKIQEMEVEELDFPEDVPEEFKDAVVQYREFLLSFLPVLQEFYDGIQKNCNLLLSPGLQKAITQWQADNEDKDQDFIEDFFVTLKDFAATFDAIIQEFDTTLSSVQGKPEQEGKKIKKPVKDKVRQLNNLMVKYNTIVNNHRALMLQLIKAYDEAAPESEDTTILDRVQPLKEKADLAHNNARNIEKDIKKLQDPVKQK